MSTRKDYLTGSVQIQERSLETQLKLDKNSAEKSIIDLEEVVAVAESNLLANEANPEFNLDAIVDAELDVSVAKDNLHRAMIVAARLFPDSFEIKEDSEETTENKDEK